MISSVFRAIRGTAMSRVPQLFSIVCVSTLLSASSLSAQPAASSQPSPTNPQALDAEPESFNLTGFVGAAFGGGFDGTSSAFGAALGYGWSPRVGLEGEIYVAPSGKQGLVNEYDLNLWAVNANVLYHFLNESNSYTPYVATGLGVLSGDSNIEEVTALNVDDTSTVLTWNFGGGVKTAMDRRWGLRADLRYFTGKDFAPDHWRLYGGVIIRRIGD